MAIEHGAVLQVWIDQKPRTDLNLYNRNEKKKIVLGLHFAQIAVIFQHNFQDDFPILL